LAIAASVVVVLGAGSVIGTFVFDARLNKQHQELSMTPPPPVTPATEPAVATTPAETLQAAEPITVVVDAAGKKPSPSANQPEERAAVEKAMPIPEPPIVEAPKPISKPTAPSPSPPRVSVNPDNHGSANTVPAGVPVEPPQGPVPSPPPRPVRVTQGVVMGGALKRVEPAYPVNARGAKQSGVVRVEVSIDERGNVTSAQVLSGPSLLRGAALAAAWGWKFKPSTIGGTPVKTSTVIDFNFKL
jgi:protein TonB